MKAMRIILLLIAIAVLNVIFADRYLIPTKKIPTDQIVFSNGSAKVENEYVLLNSKVFVDDGKQMENDALKSIGKYKVAVNGERYFSFAPQNLTSLKVVEMPNGTYELTDLSILIQYKDTDSLDMIKSDYGLIEIELFPLINAALYSVQNIQQINQTVAALSNDPRVENVSFNLVEMTEVTE